MNDHVAKPIDPAQLFSTLLKWVKPVTGTKATPADQSEDVKIKDEDVAAAADMAGTDTDLDDIPASLPGFNLELGLKRLQGNRRLYRKLLVDFVNGYGNTAADIHQALKDDDMKQVHSLVHNIKGLAGNLSAISLQDAATEMDSLVKRVLGGESLNPDRLESEFSNLKTSLEEALASCQLLKRSDESDADVAKNLADFWLPPDLARRTAERIHEAADLGNISELKLIAEELIAESDSYAEISKKIKQLTEDFDFEGVNKFADELIAQKKAHRS